MYGESAKFRYVESSELLKISGLAESPTEITSTRGWTRGGCGGGGGGGNGTGVRDGVCER